MKLKIYTSLHDVKTFLGLDLKLWKFLLILIIILKVIFIKIRYIFLPITIIFFLLKVITKKDPKLIELIMNHYKDNSKYYNP